MIDETNDGEDIRPPDGPVRFHPLCEAFPVMPKNELQRLAESIKTNGLREPIVLAPDNSILDGRNRFICCQRSGVEPRFRRWSEEADGPLLQFVLDKNEQRRQLTTVQRAMVGARLADMKRGTRTDLASAEAMSDAEAAAAMGVSESSVERAKAVMRLAHPSVVTMLERGEIGINTVLQAVRAEPDGAVQADWSATDVKEAAKRVRASARHARAEATGTEEPETKPAGDAGGDPFEGEEQPGAVSASLGNASGSLGAAAADVDGGAETPGPPRKGNQFATCDVRASAPKPNGSGFDRDDATAMMPAAQVLRESFSATQVADLFRVADPQVPFGALMKAYDQLDPKLNPGCDPRGEPTTQGIPAAGEESASVPPDQYEVGVWQLT